MKNVDGYICFFASEITFKLLYVLHWLRDYKIVDTLLHFRQRYLHDKVERYKKYSDYMIRVTEAMPDGKCRTVRTQHKIWFDNEFYNAEIQIYSILIL